MARLREKQLDDELWPRCPLCTWMGPDWCVCGCHETSSPVPHLPDEERDRRLAAQARVLATSGCPACQENHDDPWRASRCRCPHHMGAMAGVVVAHDQYLLERALADERARYARVLREHGKRP